MKVRVRLFAELRERAGSEWLELEVSEGCRVRDVLEQLSRLLPEAFRDLIGPGAELAQGYTVLIGNRRASLDEEVSTGWVMAVLPPVGGGL
ncbi:MAG: MoaD family protein [Candidatus Nezhaarchaeales archaeon]